MVKKEIKNQSSGIVLGLYGPNGLGVVRSLGQENIPVNGFHRGDAFPHSIYSKYISSANIVKNEEELLEKLIKFGERQDKKGVVFCTGDDYTLFVEENFQELNRYFHVPFSEYGPIKDIVDKTKVLEIGQKAGFTIPKHAKLSEEKVFEIEYPVFIKPINSVVGNKNDMGIVQTKKQLKEMRKKLLTKYGDLEVETFIPGPIENQIEIHTYLTSKGIPLIAGMLQYQTDFLKKGYEYHTGWSEISADFPELVKPAKKLTEMLKFMGPLDINLKKSDLDGKYYFNEVNMRSSGNIMIDTAFGLNLPAIIYKDVNEEDFSHLSSKKRQVGKHWISDRRIIGYQEEGIPIDLEKLAKLMRTENVHSFFDPNDLAPFYLALVKGELSGFNVEVDLKKNKF